MNGRYRVLQTLGTLSIVLAWILLIVGIAGAIGAWITLGDLGSRFDPPLGALGLIGFIPALLFGIGNFLQFFVVGKVLHLLVGLDENSTEISQELRRQATRQDS